MSTPSISSSNSTSKSINKFLSANTTQDDHAPLWAYVTISDKAKDGGGNKSWTCNFCNKSFKSSYSRVKVHLLRIHKGGIGVRSKLVVDLDENKIKPKHVPLPTEKDNSSLKRRNMGLLEKSFNTEDRDHLLECSGNSIQKNIDIERLKDNKDKEKRVHKCFILVHLLVHRRLSPILLTRKRFLY
ncbi:hypothetical protein Lal_00027110 [Lupinus albus]|nr:hypothetical protein Lal_00027110 [Lupinus albus]